MNYNDKQTNRRVYAVDFDGVLTTGASYTSPEPDLDNIDKVIAAYRDGHIIIIWTARQWEDAPTLVAWLTSHKVPFHGLMMSKGGADVYIDDKMGELPERELPEEA